MIYSRQRALSLLAMYSRSSDTNCNAHEARAEDATSKLRATSYLTIDDSMPDDLLPFLSIFQSIFKHSLSTI